MTKNSEYSRRYRLKYPEKVAAKMQRWWKANADKKKTYARRANLKKYGITIEAYDELVRAQGGQCAICGITPEKQLRVDHCHKSAKVRGLLCEHCNVGIGMFKENPAALCNAIDYLTPKLAVIHAA